MAVSLRGSSTKGFGVGYPISAPSGLADGDVVYIWIETAADSNARTLSGFTVLRTGNRAGTYVHLLRGEISGTPPSGFSPTNGVSGDNTICVALYDQDLTNEVVGTLLNEAGDGADQEIPGVTIADDDSYLLAFVASNGNTNPAVEALSSIAVIGYATLRGDPVNAGATGSQTLDTTSGNPWSNYHFGVLVGVPPSGGGGITQEIGLTTETDAAQPVTPAKSRALDQATETGTVFALSARKTRAIGLATETDTAQPTTPVKSKAIGQAIESNVTLSLAAQKLRGLGFAAETDEAFAITEQAPAGTLGLTSETDEIFALTPIKTRTLGLTAETDTTFALTTIKARSLGVALETDSAFSLTEQGATGALGLALETDEVLPLVVVKTRGLGLVEESDAAQPLVVTKVRELGLAAETDTVFALGSAKARTLGLAAEADAVFALTVVGGTEAPTIVAVELAYTAATCTLTYGGASVELEFV